MNNLPPVTKNLLIVNVLCFLGMIVLRKYGIDLTGYVGLHFFMASHFNPVQIVTYMFMHANFEHILFNMFALWMFGRTLEAAWGQKRFLLYYILCGVGAALIQELVQYMEYVFVLSNYQVVAVGSTHIPMEEYLNMMNTIGASGAIYGILMGFGMLFPNAELFLIPIPFPVKAKYFVFGYIVLELFLGIFMTSDGVAHFAHLGGMIFGFILIRYWRKKGQIGRYNF